MPKKPSLVKLSEQENAIIYKMAEGAGYNDKQLKGIFKLIEKQRHTAKDVDYFLNKEFKEKQIEKVLKLSEEEGIDTLKETNSYIKLAGKANPRKVSSRISQFTKSVSHFESALENVEKRTWDPKTKSIEIKLKGGGARTLTFKNVDEFNAHKQADIDSLKNKIEYEKTDKVHHERIKKFKKVI